MLRCCLLLLLSTKGFVRGRLGKNQTASFYGGPLSPSPPNEAKQYDGFRKSKDLVPALEGCTVFGETEGRRE